MFTFCTTGLMFKNYNFRLQVVFVRFVWISEHQRMFPYSVITGWVYNEGEGCLLLSTS
jgi:hypothetical protein